MVICIQDSDIGVLPKELPGFFLWIKNVEKDPAKNPHPTEFQFVMPVIIKDFLCLQLLSTNK